LRTGYFFFLDGGGAGGGSTFGWSPSTVFKGQMLNAGHFLQPATTAMGQTVMAFSSGVDAAQAPHLLRGRVACQYAADRMRSVPMDDLSANAWLLILLVGVMLGWALFLAWSSGVLGRWLQSWGVRGARAFAQPSKQVASPEVHRQHHGGHAPRHVGGHAEPAVKPHRSGKRRSRNH
jgi:hypothetical protein